MAQFWTRKKEDYKKEDTLQAEDFLKRVSEEATKNKVIEKPRIENTK